jgi:hypothetical protein
MDGARRTQNAPALKIPGLRLLQRESGGRREGNLPSQMDGRINYSDWIKKVGAGAANTRQPHTAIIIIILGVCAVGDGNIKPSARQCRGDKD